MLHFVNGSNVADTLRQAGIGDTVVEAADLLHEGPCPAGAYGEAWVKARARYLASVGYATEAEAQVSLGTCAAAIGRATAEDEVVLWFEHDLFDQLLLVWLLDALAEAGVGRERVRLIVIGRHPEIAHFHGLGQLDPSQLAALLPARAPLAGDERVAAREAWRAVCDPDPRQIEALARTASHPLPWLPGALGRLLEEFPASDGLSRTERQGLTAIAGGATTLAGAFREASRLEERVFLGDLPFAAAMTQLAECPTPLIVVGPGKRLSLNRDVALTASGAAALAGTLDHAAVNGLDRWVGGVHLVGRSPRFRWHRNDLRLVAERD